MKRCLFFLALATTSLVYPYGSYRPEFKNGPWFTGPLLTPASYTVPVGEVQFEPYLFINREIGTYNGHWQSNSQNKSTSVVIQLPVEVGLTGFIDLVVIPSGSYTNVQGHTGFGFNDLFTKINFQVWEEHEGSAAPAIKVSFREDFPTGKYKNLNPSKRGADASGEGAFRSAVALAIGKMFHLGGTNYLRLRSNFSYAISSAVPIEGFNVYGGSFKTKGKVYPGNEFTASIGLEYTPTLHVAFALDIFGVTSKKNRFKGTLPPSLLPDDGIPDEQLLPFGEISINNRSSEQLSLAPAFEYNFSQRLGIISGAWFSIVGRNTSRFVNGVIAINMYF